MTPPRLFLTAAFALAGLATPLGAQQPATTNAADLNKAVASANADAAEANATAEGQYQNDLLVYRKAVAEHSAGTMSDKARYERQQVLYAQAMAAWRKQDAACKTGDTEGCKHPSPDPKDFY